MQKIFQDKRMVLVFAMLALFSLVLLTNALGKMDFQPSQPIGGWSAEEAINPVNLGGLLQTAIEVPFWKQITFWSILFLLLLLITALLNPELRKKLIQAFLRVASFALLLLYLMKEQPQLFAGFFGQLGEIGQGLTQTPQTEELPAPVFTPPQEVSWLSFAVGLGILLAVILLIWWGNRFLNHLRQKNSENHLEDFVSIARNSLSDLKAGKNYENAIIECYDRMSEVVARKQGLQRKHEMTPSEFSAHLTRVGLPRDPIQTLTLLFESVRYGKASAGQKEINQAIHCLTSILNYCGEPA